MSIQEFFHLLLHSSEHTLIEVAKLLPFLFLTYLLMELLEHKAGEKTEKHLRRAGRIGPLVGGALGLLPQCGFSAAAAGLYAGRVITAGTLIAVFLSTSDEMLPILISSGAPISFTLKILAAKLTVGVLCGFFVDLIARKRGKEHADAAEIEEICEREGCHCEGSFWRSALKHTLRVGLFILIFIFLMNLLIALIGEDTLGGVLSSLPVLSNVLAALIGLIPNCASSVLLTQLCLEGILPVGAMLSGLLVNAGLGTALLLRNNRPLKDSLRIIAILFGIGVAVGILVDLTPLQALLKL